MVNGVNNNGIISCSDVMMQVVNYAQSGEANKIHNVWKDVVSKIHSSRDESENSERRMPIGQRLASNTRVVDLKNGILLVETDHPGWIQYLNIYKKFIITGLNRQLPELKIHSLAFRVSGNDCRLSEQYDDMVRRSQEKVNAKLDEQEKQIEEHYASLGEQQKCEEYSLPPELMAKFESIKSDMLTNNKNK